MAVAFNMNNFSDSSTCSSPSGSLSLSPQASPMVHPLLIEDGVGIRLDHFWDRKRHTFNSSAPSAAETSITTPSEGSLRDNSVRNICFIGAGYVGGPTAAVIALHNPHIRVEVLDRDEGRIKRWRSSHLPIHEPGLGPVVRVARDGARRVLKPDEDCVQDDLQHIERRPNLFFTTDTRRAISKADIIFLAVNTPTKTFGVGAGRATNMSALDGSVQCIAQHARPGTIIVEKSTVPIGTARRIRSKLRVLRPGVRFEVLSNPEFLAEGTAIENLMRPDRVLIGCSDTPSGRIAADVLAEVYASWVPRLRIVESNVWSSELTKLVANAMLAQRISSINSVSAICEHTGADVDEIAKAIGRDPRIGPQFLKAGLGFGGSCFRKDILSLVYIAESCGLEDVADYWRSVNSINERQRLRFAQKVIKKLDENLVGKKIVLLGFAFKKNTGDPRESLAVDVVKTLLDEMPNELAIFDPYCKTRDIARELTDICPCSRISKHEGDLGAVQIYDDVYQACSKADALLVITDHPQFKVSRPDVTRSQSLASVISESESKRRPAVHKSFNDETYQVNTVSFRLSMEPVCSAGAARCPDCAQTGPTGPDSTSEQKAEPLQWRRLLSGMREPRFVFDSRGVVDARRLEALGIEVSIESIGKGRSFADEIDDGYAAKPMIGSWDGVEI